MNGDPVRQRVLVANIFAALAYFFCIHGAHAAVDGRHAHVRPAPAHAVLVSAQLRPA
jgi:hypothetical protein